MTQFLIGLGLIAFGIALYRINHADDGKEVVIPTAQERLDSLKGASS